MAAKLDKFHTIDFEETELRLGLPGGKAGISNESEALRGAGSGGYGKRGFLETVDLKLNLSSKDSNADKVEKMKEKAAAAPSNADPAKPPAKYGPKSFSLNSVSILIDSELGMMVKEARVER